MSLSLSNISATACRDTRAAWGHHQQCDDGISYKFKIYVDILYLKVYRANVLNVVKRKCWKRSRRHEVNSHSKTQKDFMPEAENIRNNPKSIK